MIHAHDRALNCPMIIFMFMFQAGSASTWPQSEASLNSYSTECNWAFTGKASATASRATLKLQQPPWGCFGLSEVTALTAFTGSFQVCEKGKKPNYFLHLVKNSHRNWEWSFSSSYETDINLISSRVWTKYWTWKAQFSSCVLYAFIARYLFPNTDTNDSQRKVTCHVYNPHKTCSSFSYPNYLWKLPHRIM